MLHQQHEVLRNMLANVCLHKGQLDLCIHMHQHANPAPGSPVESSQEAPGGPLPPFPSANPKDDTPVDTPGSSCISDLEDIDLDTGSYAPLDPTMDTDEVLPDGVRFKFFTKI